MAKHKVLVAKYKAIRNFSHNGVDYTIGWSVEFDNIIKEAQEVLGTQEMKDVQEMLDEIIEAGKFLKKFKNKW